MTGVLVVLFILIVIAPLSARLARERTDAFVMLMNQEVAARGGTVLRVEVVRWHRGPFLRKGRGPRIVKMIYQDATGGVRQLWGRRSRWGNDLRWDYSDGDNRV